VGAASAALTPPAHAQWKAPCVPQTTTPTCHFWSAKLRWVDDGDTIDVYARASSGRRNAVRVRITGIQAMEQTVYTSRPQRRRGECHALAATARLERLIREGHRVVHLAAQDPASETGGRLRRSVSVRIGGAWLDVGRVLIAEGHALWLANPIEYAWNATYGTLAQQAAAVGRNLWDTDACGSGPSQRSPLRLTVNPDPPGDDYDDVDGEWVRIDNLDPYASVGIGGWWLRDSALRRYYFPPATVVPALGDVVVHVGRGANTDTVLYWGLRYPIFDNDRPDGRAMGDGAYLFDFQGDLRSWTIYPCRLPSCAQPSGQ
jgi:endonuclease YncB( thermonuclease family)